MALMATASVETAEGTCGIITKVTAFQKGSKGRFTYVLFCNTVSTRACTRKQEHESFHWES